MTEGLILRYFATRSGKPMLKAAHVGALVGDPGSWPGAGRLSLNGFTYHRIQDQKLTDLRQRLDRIDKVNRWKQQFCTQPYSQRAKVYPETGHESDARIVLYHLENGDGHITVSRCTLHQTVLLVLPLAA